jgi:hypothetical protein
MQVSKGLKRATGRGEQVQHHLGALNFYSHFELSMASSPKFRDSMLFVCLGPRRCPLQRRSRDPRSWTSTEIQTLSSRSPWEVEA